MRSRPRGDLYLLYVHALLSVYQAITDTLIYHIILPLYQHYALLQRVSNVKGSSSGCRIGRI